MHSIEIARAYIFFSCVYATRERDRKERKSNRKREREWGAQRRIDDQQMFGMNLLPFTQTTVSSLAFNTKWFIYEFRWQTAFISRHNSSEIVPRSPCLVRVWVFQAFLGINQNKNVRFFRFTIFLKLAFRKWKKADEIWSYDMCDISIHATRKGKVTCHRIWVRVDWSERFLWKIKFNDAENLIEGSVFERHIDWNISLRYSSTV